MLTLNTGTQVVTAMVQYRHRARLDAAALGALFLAAWGDAKPGYVQVLARSFTWVSAHVDDDLVGFVNVAWDGGVHFFLLDTTVHPHWQHQRIGTRLVHEAIADCRGHGHHLHVGSSADLMRNFYGPAGFTPTNAGVVSLLTGVEGKLEP